MLVSLLISSIIILSSQVKGFAPSHLNVNLKSDIPHFSHCSTCTNRRNNQITCLFSESTSNNDDSDDSFMSSLMNRIQQVQDKETKLPLIVLDSMLPRQTLKLQIKNKLLQQLIQHRLQINETPTLGMLGKAILQSGEVINLSKGVEVHIKVVQDNFVELKAGRRFRLEGEVENAEGGWTEGRVTFLSSQEEEEYEIQQNLGSQDPVKSYANAISKVKELTAPNMNLPNNVSLIERWIELAKENERQPGQIETLLEDLGEIPNEDEPSEIAFWIGSMINPLPAMGVAVEIRPALLMSESAEERIKIAHDGLVRSIKHMDGSARMW